MSELILHHFPSSPFGEKIRLVMGLKKLKWLSVDAELILPKPKLTALTGGYRKTPVMQIGADIYCDSRLIADELERRFPEKTLFPNSAYAVCHALSSFTDRDLLIVCSGLAIGVNKKSFSAELMRDRKNLFGSFLNIDVLDTEIPYLISLLRSYLAVVENQLSDQRLFWAGDSPSIADLAIYAQIWTVRSFVPAASSLFLQFPLLQQWERRIGQVGHGEPTPITRDDAIHIARNNISRCENEIDPLDPLGLHKDDLVEVTPTDYGCIPVKGKLVTLTTREVAIERENPEVGTVVVHFPRIGFKIVRSQA
ncbi:hypothetical protein BZL39_H02390 [Zygosaccharomyces parabailii]|nr:hypothetical protein BZL39_H02390 [Zygosaccharomyces parabailii]CDH14235.1 uncharacterized protein ZBAI_06021 [Zygosaccharomyces bailii ISA1307]